MFFVFDLYSAVCTTGCKVPYMWFDIQTLNCMFRLTAVLKHHGRWLVLRCSLVFKEINYTCLDHNVNPSIVKAFKFACVNTTLIFFRKCRNIVNVLDNIFYIYIIYKLFFLILLIIIITLNC